MPDTRTHRGPHPRDAEQFAYDRDDILRSAVRHLSCLLSNGYVNPSALKLVGDRFELTARQRTAVLRAACPNDALDDRSERRLEPAALYGRAVRIDGFNLVTTVEAALGGGVLLIGRDGVCRDMASMHGNYRRVAETGPALEAVRDLLDEVAPAAVHWLLDRPVSNSGRLAAMIRDVAGSRPWTAACVPDPDVLLLPGVSLNDSLNDEDADGEGATNENFVAITADAGVLDRCGPWCDLAGAVTDRLKGVWRVDLSGR